MEYSTVPLGVRWWTCGLSGRVLPAESALHRSISMVWHNAVSHIATAAPSDATRISAGRWSCHGALPAQPSTDTTCQPSSERCVMPMSMQLATDLYRDAQLPPLSYKNVLCRRLCIVLVTELVSVTFFSSQGRASRLAGQARPLIFSPLALRRDHCDTLGSITLLLLFLSFVIDGRRPQGQLRVHRLAW